MRRRSVLGLPGIAAGAALATGLAGCEARDPAMDAAWAGWQRDLRAMETIARRRGWEVTPFHVAPVATAAEVRWLERLAGVPCPTVLRTLLTTVSGRVAFGWHVPAHLSPPERLGFPRTSSLRNRLWDLDWIVERAIPNFLGWKRDLAAVDVSEAPNEPAMWEGQFPIGEFVNGDMLTVDVSSPGGPQPVRYFSHELEGLHGVAVAPDLVTFIGTLAALGWAGSEQDSWFRFLGPREGRSQHLDAGGEGARAWRAWIERDPAARGPDEMPFAIVARTPAEHALLAAARANLLPGVAAALDAGARPDVVRDTAWHIENGSWDLQFATALIHAIEADDLPMLDLLLRRGAALDTRRLPMLDAAGRGGLEVVRRLIAAGARVNGWRDTREWPIHRLVARRAAETPESAARARASLLAAGVPPAEAARLSPPATDTPTLLAILDALLEVGADPDAPWDNGLTMLMVGGTETGARLLAHRADVHRRDAGGRTALHHATSAAKVRLLVAHGAEVNAPSSPPAGEDAVTPLQAHLLARRFSDAEIVPALLALGADPRLRDGAGRTALAYCRTVADFEAMRAFGLDTTERMPDGGTLLHHLARSAGVVRARELALLDHLLGLGLDVNATDDAGRTLLHIVAAMELTAPEDVAALLARGADRAVRDRDGRRAYDHAPASHGEVRALLR